MIDPWLIKFIEKKLKRNFSFHQIKNTLTSSGYDIKTIEEHIKYTNKGKSPKINKTKTFAIILIAIVLLSVFFILANQNIVLTIFNRIAKEDVSFVVGEHIDCNNFDEQGGKEFCLRLTALKENNKQLCDDIKRDEGRDYCVALMNKDFSLCRNITGKITRAKCFGEVAYILSDSSICTSILNNDVKSYCNAISTNKNYLCYNLTLGVLRDDCLLFTAKSSSDDTGCEGIEDLNNRIRCYAIVNDESKSCENINRTIKKNKCFLQIYLDFPQT